MSYPGDTVSEPDGQVRGEVSGHCAADRSPLLIRKMAPVGEPTVWPWPGPRASLVLALALAGRRLGETQLTRDQSSRSGIRSARQTCSCREPTGRSCSCKPQGPAA